ncbi:MAG: hypothetical protein OQK82_04360, partial [Candidatus Pacearchaeota archaeon]|nr:hypothetical protein [Candidatus Pacearchaeota archaeon]
NGQGFDVPPVKLEDISSEDLRTYCLNQLKNGITGTQFVYNNKGEGLLLSDIFKEGYNSITLHFTDSYSNKHEILLQQHIVPPFILPVKPLQDQYLGKNDFIPDDGVDCLEILMQAQQIDEDIIEPGWFTDATALLSINGQLIDENYLIKNDTDQTFLYYTGYPNHDKFILEDGNHIIEMEVTALNLTSYSGWQFWVDRTPPIISFPQKMIFSTLNDNDGSTLLAYVQDSIPYRNYTSTIETEVDTVFLNSLNMSILDINGNVVVQDFVDKQGPIRLGTFGEKWNGKNNLGNLLSDGIYYLQVTAEDRCGNATIVPVANPTTQEEIDQKNNARVIIDNNGPQLTAEFNNYVLINNKIVYNTESAISSNTPSLSYTVEIDEWEEEAYLKLEFTNTSTMETLIYNIGNVEPGSGVYDLFVFAYSELEIKDGTYSFTLSGKDILGNETRIQLPEIEVDRTPPTLSLTHVSPFTISSMDEVFTLSFLSSTENDTDSFRSDTLSIHLAIIDSDGTVHAELTPETKTVIGGVDFKESFTLPTNLEEGVYLLKITVTDSRNNSITDHAAFALNAILPEITSVMPCLNATEPLEVYGNGIVTIAGTAIDPHFDNAEAFHSYALYYKEFSETIQPGMPTDLSNPENEGWQISGLSVPLYQQVSGSLENIGRFPVQENQLLAILDGTIFTPGQSVMLLLVVEETNSLYTGSMKEILMST